MMQPRLSVRTETRQFLCSGVEADPPLLRGVLPDLYNFHPETFNLPVDYLAFENAALGDMEQRRGKGGKSNKSYIIKPDDGACGVGIFITRKPSASQNSTIRAPISFCRPRPCGPSTRSLPGSAPAGTP